jgi:hypothetical protein
LAEGLKMHDNVGDFPSATPEAPQSVSTHAEKAEKEENGAG